MAVQVIALRNLGPVELGMMIKWGDAFSASNVSGHGTLKFARVQGRLDTESYDLYSDSHYAVYSYETAIAWRTDETWYIPEVKYSPTTSFHQKRIKEALTAVDVEYILL